MKSQKPQQTYLQDICKDTYEIEEKSHLSTYLPMDHIPTESKKLDYTNLMSFNTGNSKDRNIVHF